MKKELVDKYIEKEFKKIVNHVAELAELEGKENQAEAIYGFLLLGRMCNTYVKHVYEPTAESLIKLGILKKENEKGT